MYYLLGFTGVKKKQQIVKPQKKLCTVPRKLSLKCNYACVGIAVFCICLYTVASGKIGRILVKHAMESSPSEMQ